MLCVVGTKTRTSQIPREIFSGATSLTLATSLGTKPSGQARSSSTPHVIVRPTLGSFSGVNTKAGAKVILKGVAMRQLGSASSARLDARHQTTGTILVRAWLLPVTAELRFDASDVKFRVITSSAG
jgi:hypothetical protein